MKIGIFDSGLGGLLIAKALRTHLPDYDMAYFGDTLHVPYGSRSADAIYDYSQRACDFLFSQDCALIIVACNTASAAALRRLQQGYLQDHYPDRRILGVVIPTLEEAMDSGYQKIGVLATEHIVQSDVYAEELNKLDTSMQIYQQAAPLLVPMIEHGGLKWITPVLEEYLTLLKEQGIEGLILACTHYPYLKRQIRNVLGPEIRLLSQDEIIPHKLENYLKRHPEMEKRLSRGGCTEFYVSDITQNYLRNAQEIYTPDIELSKVEL